MLGDKTRSSRRESLDARFAERKVGLQDDGKDEIEEKEDGHDAN